MLPGAVNGLQLAFFIRQNFPEVGLVIASGTDRPRTQSMPANTRFFPKPYDIEQVIEHIRRMTLATSPRANSGRERDRT
jgi:two-component system, response regulator PdtaR